MTPELPDPKEVAEQQSIEIGKLHADVVAQVYAYMSSGQANMAASALRLRDMAVERIIESALRARDEWWKAKIKEWNRYAAECGMVGSEFFDDPKRVFARVRQIQDSMLDAVKQRNAERKASQAQQAEMVKALEDFMRHAAPLAAMAGSQWADDHSGEVDLCQASHWLNVDIEEARAILAKVRGQEAVKESTEDRCRLFDGHCDAVERVNWGGE